MNFNEYPCCKEKEKQQKESSRKMLFWAFWITSGIPMICMFAFHDLIFDYAWNPLDFVVAVLPLIWGIPLLIGWMEYKNVKADISL